MTDCIKTTEAEKTTAIFLHIRKTAGRCLDTEILRREYAPEEHFNIDVQDFKARVATLRSLPEEAKRRIRLVEGHIGFGFHQLLPQQAAYVTLLRDPVVERERASSGKCPAFAADLLSRSWSQTSSFQQQ